MVVLAVAVLGVCLVLLPLIKWVLLLFMICAVCATSFLGGMDKIELAWFTANNAGLVDREERANITTNTAATTTKTTKTTTTTTTI